MQQYIYVHTMYDDISSTVIMLRQFDQRVPAHKIYLSAKRRPGNTMSPALSQEIIYLFANRNSSKNIQLFTQNHTVYRALLSV